MKVTGPTSLTPAGSARPTRGAGGFSVPADSAGATAQAKATAATGGVAGVSALMALQGVEDATERKRRAIRRGSGLLDRLDDLKLALLGGEDGAPALERLSRQLREERPDGEDAGLNQVLDHIDARVAVELAKAEMRRAA